MAVSEYNQGPYSCESLILLLLLLLPLLLPPAAGAAQDNTGETNTPLTKPVKQ